MELRKFRHKAMGPLRGPARPLSHTGPGDSQVGGVGRPLGIRWHLRSVCPMTVESYDGVISGGERRYHIVRCEPGTGAERTRGGKTHRARRRGDVSTGSGYDS